MSRPVELRPEAEDDVRDIYAHLESARPGYGTLFVTRLRKLFEQLETMPELYGIVWQNVRAVRVSKIRYVAYYIVEADRVDVVAVLHGSQHPTAWQSRV